MFAVKKSSAGQVNAYSSCCTLKTGASLWRKRKMSGLLKNQESALCLRLVVYLPAEARLRLKRKSSRDCCYVWLRSRTALKADAIRRGLALFLRFGWRAIAIRCYERKSYRLTSSKNRGNCRPLSALRMRSYKSMSVVCVSGEKDKKNGLLEESEVRSFCLMQLISYFFLAFTASINAFSTSMASP